MTSAGTWLPGKLRRQGRKAILGRNIRRQRGEWWREKAGLRSRSLVAASLPLRRLVDQPNGLGELPSFKRTAPTFLIHPQLSTRLGHRFGADMAKWTTSRSWSPSHAVSVCRRRHLHLLRGSSRHLSLLLVREDSCHVSYSLARPQFYNPTQSWRRDNPRYHRHRRHNWRLTWATTVRAFYFVWGWRRGHHQPPLNLTWTSSSGAFNTENSLYLILTVGQPGLLQRPMGKKTRTRRTKWRRLSLGKFLHFFFAFTSFNFSRSDWALLPPWAESSLSIFPSRSLYLPILSVFQ